MLNLIPLPYRILIFAALITTGYGFGYVAGGAHAQAVADAAQLKQSRADAAATQKQIAKNNELSGRLAAAERAITIRNVEVIKYVNATTTGRLCLGSDAVRLLQPGATARINPATRKPATENADPFASDTDVAYWIAAANKDYETCAERLNTLIDAVQRNSPQPEVGTSPQDSAE